MCSSIVFQSPNVDPLIHQCCCHQWTDADDVSQLCCHSDYHAALDTIGELIVRAGMTRDGGSLISRDVSTTNVT